VRRAIAKPRRRAALAALAALLLLGCGRAPGDAPSPGEPPVAEPGPPFVTPAPQPMPPAIAAVADPCAPYLDEFARALAAAPGSCRIDGDCACYPGGIGEASGCGGVTDAITARALDAIAGRYLAAGCDHTVQCAPWICMPRCVDGTCAAAPPPTR